MVVVCIYCFVIWAENLLSFWVFDEVFGFWMNVLLSEKSVHPAQCELFRNEVKMLTAVESTETATFSTGTLGRWGAVAANCYSDDAPGLAGFVVVWGF